ncbi:putative nucleotidyltransferase with HDIG domain [Desulfosalsimonas propionicica]|uniref:Putative nucleotidyltransferase with HDIG domain n=1 Tax=Desulfosalsimonas propionicica TaxID=332175 RepID=A0A7W0C7N9_9BACT|nr:HD domain-containing phosphohydrolase [Desulfosalsimonas propionicica]MBA2880706.1 putative nucleotidyltransferase with HDIG domain [Desulfosalsimonas propionicica]
MEDPTQIRQPNPSLYNSRIIKAYLHLVRKKYPDVQFSEVMAHAGMTPYEVEDQGHWFTQEQVDRFHGELVRKTGNIQVAREAGLYAAFPESIGAIGHYFYTLANPRRFFAMIEQAFGNLSRSVDYKVRQITPGKVEITVTPKPGVRENLHHCENRKGFFEAMFNIFDNRVTNIEHPECMARGDSVCRYIITCKRSAFDYFRIARTYIFGIFAMACILSFFLLSGTAALTLFSGFAVLMAATGVVSHRLARKNLAAAMRNLQNSSEQLVDQIEINYNNTQVTREIGQVVNRYTSLETALDSIARILETRLDYDRGMIMLCNAGKNRLKFAAGFGYGQSQSRFLKNIEFQLDNPNSRGVFVLSFHEQKPFLINDLNDIEGTLSDRSLEFAKQMGALSFICCPIICDNESLGVVAVDNMRSKRKLLNSDMSLLMGVSHMIGISIRHTQHIEARENQLKSVLKVMISSIDARDPVTKGHSEFVAEYASGICHEMGIDKDYQEAVRVAALLHDYGKIGIPDSLLKKRDRLTPAEYEQIKSHAGKTYEILKQMNFEGNLEPVPEIAGAHHEKINGTGYPLGLTEKEIPLGAKIIAVADYFEALTANRYYHRPIPPEQAMRQLEEFAGTLFDTRVVEAFIRYYENNNPGYQQHEFRRDRNIHVVSSRN